MPPALTFDKAETQGGGMSDAVYDQMGMPRDLGSGQANYAPSGDQSSAVATPSGTTAAAPAQITVNVQAMDARSFLDRSSDIAAAVRHAMLNLNSINDVVSDL